VPFDYAKMQLTAQQLLAKFGAPITLRKVTEGGYDPTTSTNTVSSVDTAFQGVVLKFGADTYEYKGELLQAADRKVLLEGAANPALRDRIVIGGVVHAIISATDISPAGTVVLWELHVRR
jgi:hypothetical protein